MCEFELRKMSSRVQKRLPFEHTPPAAAEPPKHLEDWEIIHTYSRRQAIEDGILVQLSGEDYEGDDWIPQMVAEAGFKCPVAMTVASFMDCVAMTKAAKQALNDIKGRLWDVLWMLKDAIRRGPGQTDSISFQLHVVRGRVRPDLVRLKAMIGPGDDGEPVITIMYPHED